jgi:hypothetical protein
MASSYKKFGQVSSTNLHRDQIKHSTESTGHLSRIVKKPALFFFTAAFYLLAKLFVLLFVKPCFLICYAIRVDRLQ